MNNIETLSICSKETAAMLETALSGKFLEFKKGVANDGLTYAVYITILSSDYPFYNGVISDVTRETLIRGMDLRCIVRFINGRVIETVCTPGAIGFRIYNFEHLPEGICFKREDKCEKERELSLEEILNRALEIIPWNIHGDCVRESIKSLKSFIAKKQLSEHACEAIADEIVFPEMLEWEKYYNTFHTPKNMEISEMVNKWKLKRETQNITAEEDKMKEEKNVSVKKEETTVQTKCLDKSKLTAELKEIRTKSYFFNSKHVYGYDITGYGHAGYRLMRTFLDIVLLDGTAYDTDVYIMEEASIGTYKMYLELTVPMNKAINQPERCMQIFAGEKVFLDYKNENDGRWVRAEFNQKDGFTPVILSAENVALTLGEDKLGCTMYKEDSLLETSKYLCVLGRPIM